MLSGAQDTSVHEGNRGAAEEKHDHDDAEVLFCKPLPASHSRATRRPSGSSAPSLEACTNTNSWHSRVSERPSILAYEEEIGVGSTVGTPSGSDSAKAALSFVSVSLIVVLAYAALLFLFEVKYLLPYDSGFAVVVLWAGSMLGGHVAKLACLPQLLGMLCSGILMKNCGDLARGLPDSWGMGVRAFGLMNILMRGGLEMDLGAVKRLGFAVVRLTVLPGVTEALASAGLAVAIFDMPFFLALAMGFILAAVSPAVVVGGMFNLQQRGYGVDKGIPSLVVAAASFDDVVAISGFSMFIGLAVGEGDVLMSALHGPMEIGLGVLAGMLAACVLSATKLWDASWKRSAVLLVFGVGFTFSAKHAHMSGAGALASLVAAGAAGQFWAGGFGGPLSLGPHPEWRHEVEHHLCLLWRYGAEPLLFAVIGSALDFGQVQASTVPKALVVIFGGVLVRCTMAFFATIGAGITSRERLFVALAWMPKATVQAALGSVPLDMIRQSIRREDDPAKYDKYTQHGADILAVAVFSILATAPAGLIVIQQLGPRWLKKVTDIDKFVQLEEAGLHGPSDPLKQAVELNGLKKPALMPGLLAMPPGVCDVDMGDAPPGRGA